jgi:hypothetical protein
MTARSPIEFVRQLLNGNVQRAGNRVQLEDANGNPITALNPVPLGSLGASEAHVGEVGGNAITITLTPVLTVAGAYAPGDFVGTSATALILANAARVSLGSGVIESAVLEDSALQSQPCELWLFDTAITPPNDNAAWTLTDAHAKTCIGVIQFSTYYASALNSVANGVGLPIGFVSLGTGLWGALVTRGSPTYATGDVTVRLNIARN